MVSSGECFHVETSGIPDPNQIRRCKAKVVKLLKSTAYQVLVGSTTAAGCEQTQGKGHLLGQSTLTCVAGTLQFPVLQALSDTFGLLAFLPV